MNNIPAGFIPNEWNQTFGAFRRLVEQLGEMQAMLAECSELTPENCDAAYIHEQVRTEVDTVQFMASDAEKHWKALGVPVATAAGRFNLNRPADDVAWCSSVLNAAWHLHNGLRRELAADNAELCVQRLPLHLGRIPNDIATWRERITAELRAGAMCISNPNESTSSQRTYTDDAIPKGLLCSEFGIEDDEFQKRIAECPRLIHPTHKKRDRNVRFDVDALINTELYNPSSRAAAILKWKKKSTSKR